MVFNARRRHSNHNQWTASHHVQCQTLGPSPCPNNLVACRDGPSPVPTRPYRRRLVRGWSPAYYRRLALIIAAEYLANSPRRGCHPTRIWSQGIPCPQNHPIPRVLAPGTCHARWITMRPPPAVKAKNCHSLNQRTISPHVRSQVLGCLHALSTASDARGRSFGWNHSSFKWRETVRAVNVERQPLAKCGGLSRSLSATLSHHGLGMASSPRRRYRPTRVRRERISRPQTHLIPHVSRLQGYVLRPATTIHRILRTPHRRR